ncbi:hypothetical protein EP331_13240 [bacterium]|nr:MAG: hypothetical protein EP331_13240 [bacterium]
MKSKLVLLFLLIPFATATSQNFSYKGYLKYLSGFNSGNTFSPIYYNGIVHQRLETTTKFGEYFILKADVRNRLFHGFSVDDAGLYQSILEMDNGWKDLTFVPFSNNDFIFQTVIDRLQFTADYNEWQFNLGRQRLNWGKSMVWSPNDLFNNYAFLDFDYEERPGSDAVHLSYSYSFASDVQLAFKPGKAKNQSVYAAMWRTNIESIAYDIQFILGKFHSDWVLGAGWAGYIQNAGFSGELSVFNPSEKTTLASSFGLNYQFENGLFAQTEFLYNGGYASNQTNSSLFTPPSPKNLFPARQAFYANASFSITPLTQAGIGIMSSLDQQIHAILPQINFSLTQDIDFFIVAQIFRGDLLANAATQQNALYLRIKWSY